MLDYSACLANTRIGSEPLQKAEILAMLQAVPCYAKQASKPGVLLVARNKAMGPRKVRCFVLELCEHSVPVLKSKLKTKTKASHCKQCGEQNCSRKQSLSTMRFLVSDQIEACREAHAKAIVRATKANDKLALYKLTHCPLSGKSLMGSTHVDHVKPFKLLAEEWALTANIEICKQKFTGKGQTKIFADGELNESWQHWHEEHADLSVVCAKANLSKGAKHV